MLWILDIKGLKINFRNNVKIIETQSVEMLNMNIRERSTLSQMFFKVRVLKNFREFHRKTPVLESLFNKLAGLQFHSIEIWFRRVMGLGESQNMFNIIFHPRFLRISA